MYILDGTNSLLLIRINESINIHGGVESRCGIRDAVEIMGGELSGGDAEVQGMSEKEIGEVPKWEENGENEEKDGERWEAGGSMLGWW